MELTVWWLVNINPAVIAVQLLSSVQGFVNPWTIAHQAFLSFTISRVCSNSGPLIQYCHPAISSSVVPFSFCFNLSQHRVFSNEWTFHIRWLKYWSFSISPSNEYSGLISFRINWFDLLALQGTLKSLLEHLSSKASILQHSSFFMVHLSHLSMTTGKAIALNIVLVGKVISLLFSTLSRFITAFLPRSKGLLISWLQSPSAVWSPRK